MRPGYRKLTIWLTAAALAVSATVAVAQTVKKPAPAEQDGAAKKDPNVSLKALDAGTKAYSSGKFEPAVQSLTAALANGGLPPPKMAQAYYYRGMAYKKQKKPAQALSDLTVAVWVNGGLSEADRASAMSARNEVYREAGLGDSAPPIANAVAAPSPSTVAPAAPAAAPAPVSTPPVSAPQPPADVAEVKAKPQPVPVPAPFATEVTPAAPAGPAERPVWQADANSTPPPPIAMPVAETPAPAPAAPAQPAAPVATLSPAPGSETAQPMAPIAGLAETGEQPASATQSSDMLAPIANAGNSISGFFSNMFGSNETPPATGSTGGAVDGPGWVKADQGAQPQGPSAQVSASEPQRALGYEVATASPQHPVAVKEAAAPAKTSSPKSSAGKYRLQLASVRSREEADRLVQELMAAHASQLGGAEAQIDEAVIGNMGTFYRVRLGPYANANDPKKLCTTLKPQGYDCQVVTQ